MENMTNYNIDNYDSNNDTIGTETIEIYVLDT
jgi:hypothetical protein